ncbi:MAG: TIR domain-containing protein [Actinobacteria bacterium]|nr:MAG: TIR domain-containing protein [Actinomycetota bacterium]
MGNIFISHVIADEPLMREIAQGLEEDGYTAWFFERDVLPGTSYLIQITRAIECCDALVLLVTPAALSSDQVSKEVVGAFERKIPFIPVLIGVRPSELKEKQPEWRHALGGTAMLVVEREGVSSCIPRIVEGLTSMGISPGDEASSFSPILSTPSTSAPAHLKERILSTRSSLEGERKQVTVLFADVVGFTSLSERLDPEEVGDLIRPAVEIMAEEIRRNEGTVAQFLGDGLMALFGAPLAHEDAPQRAIHAALSIQRRLAEYGEKLKLKGIRFKMRVGINTGLVVVGRIGDDLTMEYTALGDTVNLASRMESAAEPGTVQVAENTFRLTEGYFDFSDLGEIEVKGKEEPVHAWRVLGALPARGRISASLSRGLSPFVGREKELDQLTERYIQAKAGHGQVVGVVGEPGVGKSRLLLQFRELLPEDEYGYLEGGCIHYGEAIAYLPILDILRSYLDIYEGESEESGKKKVEERLAGLHGYLEEILPPLQELLSLAVDDESYLSLEPAQRRERAFEAIRHLLIAESQQRPLIPAIEDLQYIDKTSEEFLSYFIDFIPAASVLLVLLYRPEYTPAWVSKTFYSQIRVDQLPEGPSAELVKAILPEGEVSPEIAGFIVGKTAGNPLFVEELTRGLLEAGSIVKDNENYLLSTEPSDISVPDTIQGIIASRLDRLPDELKQTMQVAAVIGREFSLRLLQGVTGIGKPLKSCLLQLQSLEFIYEKSLFPEPEYIFKHALTQEVAYESLLLKRRREIHGKIGQAIETTYPDTLEDFYETLAYHYSRSEDTGKALHYLELSGEKSARNYANWEAVSSYQEAIRLLDAQPESKERKKEKLGIYRSLIDTMMLLSYPQGSMDVLQDAERLAQELGDDRSLTAVYRRLAAYHSIKGDTALGLMYSEKCFDAAERLGDMDTMAMIASGTCLARLHAGEISEAAEISRRALKLLEEQHREHRVIVGGWTAYSQLSGLCIEALGALGEFGEEGEVFEKGLLSSLEADDAFGTGWVEYNHCLALHSQGDGQGLIDHARKAIERFEETGIEIVLGTAWSVLGTGYLFKGSYEQARENVEKGLELQRKVGVPINLPLCLIFLSLFRLAVGDLEGAASSAEEALRLSRDYGAKSLECASLLTLGRVSAGAESSRIDIAERYIRQAMSLSEEMKTKPLNAGGHLYLGEIFEQAGRREEALENLMKAEEMYLEMDVGSQSHWLTRIQEALALLA